MKHYFITNPAAGKKNSCEELCERIITAGTECGADFEIYETTAAGDATRFVKEMCESFPSVEKRFYACGGDGTLNEVVSGAVGQKNASVGLIPAGSGNDFARNFKNNELFFDIKAQIAGEATPVDVLALNDKFAINMVNIGFDCEVVKRMVRIKRSPLCPAGLAYIFGLVITLITKPGVKVEVSIDGGEYKPYNLLLCTNANGCYCGGGFHSNPHALLTDGKINFLFVNNVSRIKFLTLVSSYKKGTHICEKNAKILSSASCSTIDMRFDGIQSVSIDGEVNDIDRELHFSIKRGGLNFVIPEGSSFLKEQHEREEATV